MDVVIVFATAERMTCLHPLQWPFIEVIRRGTGQDRHVLRHKYKDEPLIFFCYKSNAKLKVQRAQILTSKSVQTDEQNTKTAAL